MRMMCVLATIVGGTAVASASSIVSILTSVNGGPFVGGNRTASLDDEVRVRVACESDNPRAVGLASFGYVLTVGNWINSGVYNDTLIPWSMPSIATDTTTPGINGPGVRQPTTGNGRRAPYASSRATIVPGTSIEFGTLLISGPVIGTAIATSQSPPTLSTNGNGSYFSSANPAQVFQYEFILGRQHEAGSSLDLQVVPVAGIDGQIKWYDNLQGTTSINEGFPTVQNASIVMVPGPGVAVVFSVGLVAVRRRR